MKGFIEVHARGSGATHLVNIDHIVEVCNRTIYTDDFLPTAIDFPHIDCEESYEEIRAKIVEATSESS